MGLPGKITAQGSAVRSTDAPQARPWLWSWTVKGSSARWTGHFADDKAALEVLRTKGLADW